MIGFVFEQLQLPAHLDRAARHTASIVAMNRLERRACQGDLGLKNPEIEVLLYTLGEPQGHRVDPSSAAPTAIALRRASPAGYDALSHIII